MSGAQEWLDRADALAAAATQGPWHVDESDLVVWTSAEGVAGGGVAAGPADLYPRSGHHPAESMAFIAASRTLVPAMSAALRAVLDLHQPVRNGILDSGSWTCAECLGYLGCRPSGPDHFCLTVRAIADALDGAA